MKGALNELTPELYRIIISIVDMRIEEIRVTRKDFDKLKAAVENLTVAQQELTKAQIRTEQRLEKLAQAQERTEMRLEELAQAQARTEQRLEKLAQAQERTEMRLEELAQAQARTEKRLEELAQAQARTEKRVDELTQAQAKTDQRLDRLAELQQQLAEAQMRTEQRVEELAEAQARTEKELRNLAHQVGRLSDTIGYGLEDLGEWILPAYLEKAYNITGIKKCVRTFITVDHKKAEINLFARGRRNGETVVVIGESKNRIGKSEVRTFAKQLDLVEKAFTEPRFAFIFGFWAHPDAQEMAKKKGIEVICSYQLTREG